MLLAWLFCLDVPLNLTNVSAIYCSLQSLTGSAFYWSAAHSALVVAYRNAAPALRIVVFAHPHSSEFLGASGGFSLKLQLKQ